jgi:hypothetical protein
MATGGDWQRVADYVRERRTELDLTQADVQAAGGPSTATQRLIEGALSDNYQPAILARLERVLGWQPRSIRAIRSGGEPVLMEDVDPGETPFERAIHAAHLAPDIEQKVIQIYRRVTPAAERAGSR